MAENKKHFWFPVKSFGFGWSLPVTWQGWLVLIGYISLTIFYSVQHPPSIDISAWLIYFIPTTIVFIAIVWSNGERPLKWRFGKLFSSKE